jgi:hypothetical protein
MKLLQLFEISKPDLLELLAQFKHKFNGKLGEKEWGGPLDELAYENGNCSMISSTLVEFLKSKGVKAKFISGETAKNKKWNLIPKDCEEGDNHTAVQVGSTIIDFTAVQFDKTFPIPRIYSASNFAAEWEKVY